MNSLDIDSFNDDDVYENTSHVYETEFCGNQVSTRPVARENDYEEQGGSRRNRGSVTERCGQDSGDIMKPYVTESKDQTSNPLRAVAICMTVLIVLILSSTVVSIYCAISMAYQVTEPKQDELSVPTAASQASESSLAQLNHKAIMNVTFAIEKMTISFAQMADSQGNILSDISSNLRVVMDNMNQTNDAMTAISHRTSKMTHPFVRIVNGDNLYSGRVEINYEGEWGTVCDDLWGIEDAKVICLMLGFPGATSAPGSAEYGPGTGPILLDDVKCNGSEASIWDCKKNPWRDENCSHSEDASVVCKL